MRTLSKYAAGVGLAALLAASPAVAQGGSGWAQPKCDIKPGHYLVNSGVLYLKHASETKFEDQKQKDLREAQRVLTQALGSGQTQNPAAWYYLARYYLVVQDLAGADTAFAKAQGLEAKCTADIDIWRRYMWVPLFNAGIAAWQAGNTDSAIASFARANAIYRAEPMGLQYLATLYANKEPPDTAAVRSACLAASGSVPARCDSLVARANISPTDSSIKYFRLAVDVAGTDAKRTQDKRESLFNLARVYHRAQRWNDAAAAYQEYRGLVPNDAEATVGLGAVYAAMGKQDSAMIMYRSILDRADSVPPAQLFNVGVAIYQAAPPDPDTAAAGRTCRSESRAANRTWTVRRTAVHCDSVTIKMIRETDERGRVNYALAARAFEGVVKRIPSYRDGLFDLANTYLMLRDSTKMLPVAQQLQSVDPLNRSSTRLLAAAWQLKGKGDSALRYLIVADSVLPLDVSVGLFAPDEQGAQLNAIVSNPREKPGAPATLVMEFLDEKGTVVATQNVDVPTLEAGGSHAVQLKVTGAGIVAWRYRKR